MTRLGLFVMLVLVSSGCSRRADLAAEEAAIRQADAAWLAAASAHDLERTASFWADDATILAPETPPVVGKDAIRKYVSAAFSTPGFSITWQTDKVVIAASGDLAYATGTDRISATGPDGKPSVVDNNSVAVWRKGPSGWKCIEDVMTPAPKAK